MRRPTVSIEISIDVVACILLVIDIIVRLI